MMFVALYLRVLILYMISLGVLPCTLADDLFINESGPSALHLFTRAYHYTRMFLQALGGKVSQSKSYTLATNEAHRACFFRHIWPHVNTTITVANTKRPRGRDHHYSDYSHYDVQNAQCQRYKCASKDLEVSSRFQARAKLHLYLCSCTSSLLL